MYKYNPNQAPDAAKWLELDESERIRAAEKYHRKTRSKVPNIRAHAVFHAVIETQVAEGHEPAVRAMSRLTSEGLTRHDALHAVGSVLAEHFFELSHDESGDAVSSDDYDAALDRLTAEDWLRLTEE